jgi:hypothetical protein
MQDYDTQCVICGKGVVAGQTSPAGYPCHLSCQPPAPDVAISSIANTWESLAHFHMNEPEWFDPYVGGNWATEGWQAYYGQGEGNEPDGTNYRSYR